MDKSLHNKQPTIHPVPQQKHKKKWFWILQFIIRYDILSSIKSEKYYVY